MMKTKKTKRATRHEKAVVFAVLDRLAPGWRKDLPPLSEKDEAAIRIAKVNEAAIRATRQQLATAKH